jgi:hypothetical protein
MTPAVSQLYLLLRDGFRVDSSEVLLLAEMIKSKRLKKLESAATTHSTVLQQTSEGIAIDYLINRVVHDEGAKLRVHPHLFAGLVHEFFDEHDLKLAIEQMRILRNARGTIVNNITSERCNVIVVDPSPTITLTELYAD